MRLFGFRDQRSLSSDPASPSAGFLRYFTKLNLPYVKDSSGTVTPLTGSGGVPDPTTMSDVEATRLGYKVYQHGTTYNGGNAPTITGGAGFSVISSAFVPYQTQSGSWRMTFNVAYDQNASATYDINVNGVVFGTLQSVTFAHFGTPTSLQFNSTNTPGDAFLLLRGTIPLASKLMVSGDTVLNAKPTWAY